MNKNYSSVILIAALFLFASVSAENGKGPAAGDKLDLDKDLEAQLTLEDLTTEKQPETGSPASATPETTVEPKASPIQETPP
jgi:hypothetical protein